MNKFPCMNLTANSGYCIIIRCNPVINGNNGTGQIIIDLLYCCLQSRSLAFLGIIYLDMH